MDMVCIVDDVLKQIYKTLTIIILSSWKLGSLNPTPRC